MKIFTNDRTGTRELRRQNYCSLWTFHNLFKFCFRSKTKAKSSTVSVSITICLECVPFPYQRVKLRNICQRISNTVWSANAHCYLSLVYIYKKAYFPAFLLVGLSPSLFLCVRWLTGMDQCFIARSKFAACFFPAVRAIPWCTSSTEPRPPPTIIPPKYII